MLGAGGARGVPDEVAVDIDVGLVVDRSVDVQAGDVRGAVK